MKSAARLLLLMTGVVSIAACGSAPVVGILLPTTGAASTYGESMKNAIEMAIEQAKNEGSYPADLTVVWADSATDPETAANEFRRLAKEGGAKIVIAGTTSGEAKLLLPVIKETGTVCLSPSATLPALTRESRLFFRVFSSDELEGRRAGRFLFDDRGKRTALIYTEDSEQARGIEPPFRQVFEQAMGGKVVGRVIVTDPGWEKEAADLLEAHSPESVYIIAYAEKTVDVLRQLRQKVFAGPICASSAFNSAEVVSRYPELLDGVYFPQPAFDTQDEHPLVQRFVEGYRERFDQDPDIYAAHAYDAMRVVFKALDEAAVMESSEIRKALLFGIKEFPGVTGIIQFNDYGDVHHNPIMFIIKDGQVRNYERYLKEEKAKIRDRIRNLLGK